MQSEEDEDEDVLENMIEVLFLLHIIDQNMYMQESGYQLLMHYGLKRFCV